MYIIVFSIITVIMEADFQVEGYDEVPKIMKIMIQIFRNSIGDIAVNNYGGWVKDTDYENNQSS